VWIEAIDPGTDIATDPGTASLEFVLTQLSTGMQAADRVKMAAPRAKLDLLDRVIPVNDLDHDRDTVPDFADGIDLHGNEGASEIAAGPYEQYVRLTVTLNGVIDPTKADIEFNYSAADPGKISVNSKTHPDTFSSDPGTDARVTVWTEGIFVQGANPIQMSRKHNSVEDADAGHWVKPGVPIKASALGFTQENKSVRLWVEGLKPSAAWNGERITVEVDPDGPPATDGTGGAPKRTSAKTETFTVVGRDLDIDSDNSGAIGTTATLLLEEDHLEMSRNSVGKIIRANTGNTTAPADAILDYADGFSIGTWTRAGANRSAKFTPISVTIPAPIDLQNAKVYFVYSESDPANYQAANPAGGAVDLRGGRRGSSLGP